MPTDTERREVARRLRECRGGWSSGECYYTIINALGLPDTSREDGGAALYARLADLIEPDECQFRDATKTVDRDALLALAKVLGGMGDRYNEHERYELGTTFKAIADRIREACGVSDDV